MLQIMNAVYLLYLYVLGVQDWKKSKVSVYSLGIGTVIALLNQCMFPSEKRWNFLVAILFSMGVFFISFITRQALGYGDAWMLANLALFLGYHRLISFLMTLSFVMFISSVLMLALKSFHKKAGFPLIPLMLVSYVGGMLF